MQWPGARQRGADIEAQRIIPGPGEPRGALRRIEPAADAGIGRPDFTLWRPWGAPPARAISSRISRRVQKHG